MKKQKTAIQQFIEELKETLTQCQPEFKTGIQHCILRASATLELERQQIAKTWEDAFWGGQDEANGDGCLIENGNQYYNETFETKNLSIELPPHVVEFGVNESKPYDYGVTDNSNK